MRKAIIAAAVLGITGAATADVVVEQVLISDMVQLAAGESASYQIDVADNNNEILGFGFAGTVTGISGTAAWASDTRLDVGSPAGTAFGVGGFDNPAPNGWAFDGSASTNDGFYSDEFTAFAGEMKGGVWSITLTNDWVGAPVITWDFEVYLIKKIPAPAGLALLGLAGLAGRRRRA